MSETAGDSFREFEYTNLDGESEIIRYCVTQQNLCSVLNSPIRNTSRVIPPVPVLPSRRLPLVEIRHFHKYLEEQSKREHELARVQVVFDRVTTTEDPSTVVDAESAITELQKTVPPLFFDDNFHFHNREVLEYIESNGWNSPNLQQEKFTHYLDLVEVELVYQISTQSNSFFHALSQLHLLRDEVTLACNEITSMRKCMKGLHRATSKSLGVTEKLTKQKNMKSLHAKMEMIKAVKATQPMVQMLLSSNDFVGALDLIKQTQSVLSNELNGVQCLRNVGFQLNEMSNVISLLMQEEFLKSSIEISNLSENNEDRIVSLENELSPAIVGLVQLKKMHLLNEEYRQRAASAIRAAIETSIELLPPSQTSVALPKDQLLENSVRALHTSEFIRWMKSNITSMMMDSLQKAADVRTVLSSVLDIMNHEEEEEEGEGGKTEVCDVYCEQILAENQNILFYLCEVCHKEIAKILSIREKEHLKIQFADFVSIHNYIQEFIVESESFTHKKCLTLRGALSAQVSGFAEKFHLSKMKMIDHVLEAEPWTQSQIAPEFQNIVNELFDVENRALRSSTEMFFVLTANGEEFCVVNSALMLLKMLSEYLECANAIPTLGFGIVNNIIDILRRWNSEADRLVLKGEAKQKLKKKLTGSNLALCCRCVKFFAVIMPKLKEQCSALLPKERNSQLNGFDRIAKDYMQHHQNIIDKLKTIVKGRIDIHCKDLDQSSVWNDSSSTISKYMVELSNAAAALHKVLYSFFPEPDMKEMFSEIYALYNSSLVECFSQLRIRNVGKKRLYNDITYLIQELSKLPVVGEQASSLNLLKAFYESQFGMPPQNL